MGARSKVLAPVFSGLAVLVLPAAALAGGSVELTPAAGVAGSPIMLHGAGFPKAEAVRIAISGRRTTVARSDRAGRFSKTLTVPHSGRGWLKIISRSGHRRVVNTFLVSRTGGGGQVAEISSSTGGRVRISPTTLMPGEMLTVHGIRFPAGKRLRLTWPGTDRRITVRRGGRFAVNAPLSDTLRPGAWLARLVGRGIRLTFRIYVSATSGGGLTVTINPPVAGAPTNTFAPGITGTTVQGQTLTADPGGWTGRATITYAYQWQRCTSGSCSDIHGATSPAYKLGAADVGHNMRVRVTATNPVGSTAALSGQTLLVQAKASPLPAGTVALWHMDALGTMTDSAGTNNGTPYGVGLDPSGFAGAAYQFNGSSWVSVPNAAALNPGSANVTITLHIKTTQPAPPTVQDWDLVRKGLYTDGSEFKVEYYPSAQAGCAFGGSQAYSGEHPAGPPLDDGAWHTIQCRKTATGISTIVDGTTVYALGIAIGTISNSADLAIGARPGSEYFQGSIDEVQITYG
jgi:hypothetical protein